MLQDAWLDARAKAMDFVSVHGDAVWIGVEKNRLSANRASDRLR